MYNTITKQLGFLVDCEMWRVFIMSNVQMAAAGAGQRKILSISSKRQITIPLSFFSVLGFEDKAECQIRDGALIIRPARIETSGEFAEEILADLIAQGYSGQELLEKFKETQAKVRPAVETMLEEAHKIATGELKGASYEDVFGED